ncbi:hypothetical protein ACAW74_02815 [Fibrella sp. WM1]|uniref:hypothetical protein n=1 Tax=Fibrella musci TaxID=3242485 RepID=UPI00351FD0BD
MRKPIAAALFDTDGRRSLEHAGFYKSLIPSKGAPYSGLSDASDEKVGRKW